MRLLFVICCFFKHRGRIRCLVYSTVKAIFSKLFKNSQILLESVNCCPTFVVVYELVGMLGRCDVRCKMKHPEHYWTLLWQTSWWGGGREHRAVVCILRMRAENWSRLSTTVNILTVTNLNQFSTVQYSTLPTSSNYYNI